MSLETRFGRLGKSVMDAGASLRLSERNFWASLGSLGAYVALLAALLAIEPLFTTPYLIRLANTILIQGISALAVNVVLGFAGLVSIAHAAFMAIGAYLSALLMIKAGVPFVVAFLAACLVCGFISGIVGYLGTRVETNYLMVITLGINEAVFLVIINQNSLTGGASGLANVPAATIGPWVLDSDYRYYGLVVPIFVAALYFAQRLRASKAGRAMVAARQHQPAARMSGVDVTRHRVWAMVFAGVYLGAAGSLFAHMVRFLGPEDFTISNSLLLTLIAVVGGLGSNIGACLSALALTVVNEEVREIATSWVFYYGILIMVIMVVAPRGLAGIGNAIVKRVRRHRARAIDNEAR
jgi:branched-chain amino acid transport system permease protein